MIDWAESMSCIPYPLPPTYPLRFLLTHAHPAAAPAAMIAMEAGPVSPTGTLCPPRIRSAWRVARVGMRPSEETGSAGPAMRGMEETRGAEEAEEG